MIINEDRTMLKQRVDPATSTADATSDDSELPPYSPTSTTLSSVSTDSSRARSPRTLSIAVSLSTSSHNHSGEQSGLSVPNLKPINFLSLSREHSALRGHFVLDPTLSVPPVVLPPLAEGETEEDRKNLSLTSATSSVNGEVWIVSGDQTRAAGKTGKRRASIEAKSKHGPVTVKIHQADTPFILIAESTHGPISVSIPRSFRGPVHTSTEHGSLRFSSALTPNVTLFSDIGSKRQGFVGDISGSGWGESDGTDWDGDELVVKSAYGSISVSYVDEPPKPGVLSWMRNAFS